MNAENHSYADIILTKQTTSRHSYLKILIDYLFLFSVYKTEQVFKGTRDDPTELMSEALFLSLGRP